MELVEMSDNLLLMVMQYLGVRDLIALQLVCKRLGALALDPRVWQHRSVPEKEPWLRTVLRLAPCLKSLHIRLPFSGCETLLETTRCAVSELRVLVEDKGAEYANRVLHHQEALGRLKGIELNLNSKSDYAKSYDLVWAATSVSGLEKLAVHLYNSNSAHFQLPPPSAHRPMPRSSLKSVRCCANAMETFYPVVLAEHAATLEEVHLQSTYCFPDKVALLLTNMPKLRELNCPIFGGLEALLACESLEKITFHSDNSSRGSTGAVELLHRAPQLREVTLKYSEHVTICFPGIKFGPGELLLAVVSRGPSRIQSLTIDLENLGESSFYGRDPTPQDGPLLKALPSMPALRTLQVDNLTDKLLRAITPASAPALRTLKEQPWHHDSGCAHRFLHRRPVATALSSNPSLKLLVRAGRFCPPGGRRVCKNCKLECHRGERVWEGCIEYKEYSSLADEDLCWTEIPRLNSQSK